MTIEHYLQLAREARGHYAPLYQELAGAVEELVEELSERSHREAYIHTAAARNWGADGVADDSWTELASSYRAELVGAMERALDGFEITLQAGRYL